MSLSCASCKKQNGERGVELKKCSQCKSAVYCNSDCQRNDWPVHAQACIGLKLGVSAADAQKQGIQFPMPNTLRLRIRSMAERTDDSVRLGDSLAAIISDAIDNAARDIVDEIEKDGKLLESIKHYDSEITASLFAERTAKVEAAVDVLRRIDAAADRSSLADLLAIDGMMATIYGSIDDGRILALLRHRIVRNELKPGHTYVFACVRGTVGAAVVPANGQFVYDVVGVPRTSADLAASIPGATLNSSNQVVISAQGSTAIIAPGDGAFASQWIPSGPNVVIATVTTNTSTFISQPKIFDQLPVVTPIQLIRARGKREVGSLSYPPGRNVLVSSYTFDKLVGDAAGMRAFHAVQSVVYGCGMQLQFAVTRLRTSERMSIEREYLSLSQLSGFVDTVIAIANQMRALLNVQKDINKLLALPRVTEAMYSVQPRDVIETVRGLLLKNEWHKGMTYIFDESGRLVSSEPVGLRTAKEIVDVFGDGARLVGDGMIAQLPALGMQINTGQRDQNEQTDDDAIIWRATLMTPSI